MEETKAIEFSLNYRFFDNALLICQELFAKTPTPEILYFYIQAYLGLNSPKQASILCKQNEHIISQSPRLQILYAQCLFETGQFSQSELILKPLFSNQTINDEMRSAIAYMSGMIKLRTHQHESSQKDFTNSIKLQPLLLTAVPYSKKEDPIIATPQERLQKRSLLTPTQLRSKRTTPIRKSLDTKSHRSVSSSYTTQLLRSVNYPFPIIKQLPTELSTSIIALKTLGLYYFKCAKYNEAAPIFARLYQLHPHTIEGIDIYSTVLWQLKDERTLDQLARRAIELAPSRAEPWIAVGNLLSLQHNTEGAIQMFQRASSIDRSNSYSLALAGHEMLLLDSLAEAAKLFRQSIDINPNEWSAWYGIGSVHFRQDNFGAAEYYTKKALELNPMNSVLYYVYGMVMCKCNRNEEAIEMFDKALELDKNNLVAAYQKAVLLFDDGDIKNATKCLEMAEPLSPHEPGVSYLRAKIAQKIGDYQKATSLFTQALIYGYPDKKEINAEIEMMSEKTIASILKEQKEDEKKSNK
ncbi:TPR Domain containing protein [Histomonas meleagridis]|uniref:TPR Domain containing protein n=1 Tax=Histomonas meleagridis TaxID=135588 RepID=UPI0035595D99|nr:TPR Domain containing protein [Histomonas meleagridis]KAH0805229.1 TPR Domain containing protein [Histomonas meleagridis]